MSTPLLWNDYAAGSGMATPFVRNLQYYRKKNLMSQGELADKLNVTHQAVSYYENGLRTCSFDMLIEIAELFGIST